MTGAPADIKAEASSGAAALLLASLGQVPVNRGRAHRRALGAARDEWHRGGLLDVLASHVHERRAACRPRAAATATFGRTAA